MQAAASQGVRLEPGHVTFVQGGVSVVVAARNDTLLADVVRGCGCRVTRDRRQVTVVVEPARSGAVLDHIAANGMIAVVFSQPSTHRTLQLKGTDARVANGTAADVRTSQRHLDAWLADMQLIGYGPEFVRAVRGESRELATVTFSIAAVFEQTPGPAAGRRIGG